MKETRNHTTIRETMIRSRMIVGVREREGKKEDGERERRGRGIERE